MVEKSRISGSVIESSVCFTGLTTECHQLPPPPCRKTHDNLLLTVVRDSRKKWLRDSGTSPNQVPQNVTME